MKRLAAALLALVILARRRKVEPVRYSPPEGDDGIEAWFV